ncbi:MAG: NAD(P)-dependent oxidoreductase [Chloroflexi bacterium]|nr:NAD(P)-dependent oxidoreductase [Chloroflexota bacterium]
MPPTKTIGVIGLGIMGQPIARNLLRAGHPLIVFTRTRASAEQLLHAGAEWAEGPAQVAQKCRTIILMLPDPPAVEQVALEILASASPGTLVIDMGTTTPNLSRRLAELGAAKGVEVLDAPVSGGQVGAEKATLSIMVGGKPEAFERALPILRVLGSNVTRVGDAGAGQIAKACNQIIVGLTIEAVAEALALATKAGVDPARVRQALLGGFAASRILELHGQRMLDRNYVPGARVRTHHKDLQIALDIASQSGAAVPITWQVDEFFQQLIAQGYGDDDHSALLRRFLDG